MPQRILRQWQTSGRTKKVEWRHVRLALMLAALCLGVSAIGIYQSFAQADRKADETAYSDALNEWKRCTDRAKSGKQVDDVNTAAVAHAEETDVAIGSIAVTLDQMIAVLEQSGSTSPRLVELRRIVDQNAEVAADYGAGVDEYREAAEAYVPQDAADCPPRPERP